ncbi:MAG TPA: DUF6668 family protein [Acidimicrobiales bacterium]|nr:DUF6668 family protein [Acidimicrobiales bacterium]
MTSTVDRQVGVSVTVSGPVGEAEVILPADVALADLLPALSLTYAGCGAQAVLVVTRPQGILDPAATLAGAGVVSGTVLNLFPFDHLPSAWHDAPEAPANPHPPRRPPPPVDRPTTPRPITRTSAGPCGWLGAHGGAGTSTLAAAFGGPDLGTYDPATPAFHGTTPVVVVARSHAAGLRAAQDLAARELAPGTGASAERVGGLVIVADTPGRPPKALRTLARLVAGGYPRSAAIGWIEGWRLGEDTLPHLPRSLRSLVTDLSSTRRLG